MYVALVLYVGCECTYRIFILLGGCMLVVFTEDGCVGVPNDGLYLMVFGGIVMIMCAPSHYVGKVLVLWLNTMMVAVLFFSLADILAQLMASMAEMWST